jgi:cytochrome c553
MIKTTTLIITASLLVVSANSMAAGDAAAGKVKAAVCAACHGADGTSATDLWPNLKGQKAGYLVKQLKAFKDGSRKDPTMAGMAAALSDEDIANLAAYYSGL